MINSDEKIELLRVGHRMSMIDLEDKKAAPHILERARQDMTHALAKELMDFIEYDEDVRHDTMELILIGTVKVIIRR